MLFPLNECLSMVIRSLIPLHCAGSKFSSYQQFHLSVMLAEYFQHHPFSFSLSGYEIFQGIGSYLLVGLYEHSLCLKDFEERESKYTFKLFTSSLVPIARPEDWFQRSGFQTLLVESSFDVPSTVIRRYTYLSLLFWFLACFKKKSSPKLFSNITNI